jgi:hypothetical protein
MKIKAKLMDQSIILENNGFEWIVTESNVLDTPKNTTFKTLVEFQFHHPWYSLEEIGIEEYYVGCIHDLKIREIFITREEYCTKCNYTRTLKPGE